MVGRMALDHLVKVRILARQPWPHRLARSRILGSHPRDTGSNPVGATISENPADPWGSVGSSFPRFVATPAKFSKHCWIVALNLSPLDVKFKDGSKRNSHLPCEGRESQGLLIPLPESWGDGRCLTNPKGSSPIQAHRHCSFRPPRRQRPWHQQAPKSCACLRAGRSRGR